MSSRRAKVAAWAGGAAPVVSMLAVASSSDPWLAIAAIGLLCALAVAVGWLLVHRPFLEISETVRDGNRKRVWRAGVAETESVEEE
jgi:membrane protein implicated in regulation of membrane protease activity